jgi:hypothetical protein
MTRSVRIHAFGDADVLRIEDVVTGELGAGEVIFAFTPSALIAPR